jgi:hypothetical protein
MNLLLLVLRLLLGTLAPSWNESVPLAVRRDGRLQNRLHRRAEPHRDLEPQRDHEPVGGVLSQVWKAVVRAVGWVGRWLWPTGRARGS